MKKQTVLSEIDECLYDIESKINVLHFVQPINIESEKRKFFDRRFNYNPQFQYNTSKFSSEKYIKILKNIEVSDLESDVELLYVAKINELINKAILISHIGNGSNSFTSQSIEIYGKIVQKYVDIADHILNIKNNVNKLENKFDSKEITLRIKEALRKADIDTTIVNTSGANIRKNVFVSTYKNKIYIHEELSRTNDNIQGLIAHEILTHLQRFKNGKLQKYRIFSLNTAGYLKTEEGLATLMTYAYRQNKIMKRTSLLLVAIHIALNYDFKSTFKQLYKYIQDYEIAWSTTVRVKRGIGDTGIIGAFTKDQYLQWSIQLGRQLIGNPKLLSYIFNGKANYEELAKFTDPIKQDYLSISQIKQVFKENQIII